MRIALVDADIVAYQACASAEQAYDWGDGMWTLHCFEEDAVRNFETILQRLVEKVEASKTVLAFSDKENWRKSVLPTYKGNRKDVRKPMLLAFIKEYASEKYDTRTIPQLEGDDVIGLNATGKMGPHYVICSIDKDLKTIPGKHYNFGRDEFFEVTEEEADYWHMTQTLTGDPTDGYGGCPGVGEVTAKKILENPEKDAWGNVVTAYIKRGLSEEEALTQARVARILRFQDYDFENHQVRLWTPPLTQ